MKKSRQKYSIKFAGLPLGEHEFDFHIDESLIKVYNEDTDIEKVEVEVLIKGERIESALHLNIVLQGFVHLPCDRCLDTCEVEIFDEQMLIYTTEAMGKKDQDNIIQISPDTDFIELDDLLYDFITLAIPPRNVHDDEDIENSKCNREILEIMENMRASGNKSQLWEQLSKHKFDN